MVAKVSAWRDVAGWCVKFGPGWPTVHNTYMKDPGVEAKANAISRHATL